MVRVLVNWWAYTWGAYIRGVLYSDVYGIVLMVPTITATFQKGLQIYN